MVHISTNCCTTEQQTSAINKLILSLYFLQSKAYGRQVQWRRRLGTIVSGTEKSIEIPGVSL